MDNQDDLTRHLNNMSLHTAYLQHPHETSNLQSPNIPPAGMQLPAGSRNPSNSDLHLASDASRGAGSTVEPLKAFAKLWSGGLHTFTTNYSCHADETTVSRMTYDQGTYSAWQFPDPLALLGISDEGTKLEKQPQWTTPRRISVTKLPLFGPKIPTLTKQAHELIEISEKPFEDYMENYFENEPFYVVDPIAMMQLAITSVSNHWSWSDEAPVIRILATLLATTNDEAMLQSTQIAPTLAYDCSAKSCQTKMYTSSTPIIRVKAMFCDLEEYFLFRRGLRCSRVYDKYDLQRKVIVLPFLFEEKESRKPVIRAMVNTTMRWWYGRVVKSLGVECQGNPSVNGRVIHTSPLAALLELESATIDGDFHVLFVSMERSKELVTELEGATSRLEIPRLSEEAKPVNIAPLIWEWTSADNHTSLYGELLDLFQWYAEHNYSNAFQNAMALTAETCFQLPMPKIITDSTLSFGYCWDKNEHNDPQVVLQTKKALSPMASLQTELEKSGSGQLGAILDDFVLRYQTPTGLLQPGKQRFKMNGVHGLTLEDKLEAGHFYYTNEADGFARLAMSFCPMVELAPYKLNTLYYNKSLMKYIQGQASLHAGISAWMAMEAGYTMFDICHFTFPDDSSMMGEEREAYDKFIAEPIKKAFNNRIVISRNMAESWRNSLAIEAAFDNVLEKFLPINHGVTIRDYNGWSLPGWFILACKKKFTGYQDLGPSPKRLLVRPRDLIKSEPDSRHQYGDYYQGEACSSDRLMATLDISDATQVRYLTYKPSGREVELASVLCDIYLHKSNVCIPLPPECKFLHLSGPKLETSAVIIAKFRATIWGQSIRYVDLVPKGPHQDSLFRVTSGWLSEPI